MEHVWLPDVRANRLVERRGVDRAEDLHDVGVRGDRTVAEELKLIRGPVFDGACAGEPVVDHDLQGGEVLLRTDLRGVRCQ